MLVCWPEDEPRYMCHLEADRRPCRTSEALNWTPKIVGLFNSKDTQEMDPPNL